MAQRTAQRPWGSPTDLCFPVRASDVMPVPVGGLWVGGEGCPACALSSVALCKLLQHGINTDDKRLQDIRVKGEEIYGVDEGVRTRAKTAKSG